MNGKLGKAKVKTYPVNGLGLGSPGRKKVCFTIQSVAKRGEICVHETRRFQAAQTAVDIARDPTRIFIHHQAWKKCGGDASINMPQVCQCYVDEVNRLRKDAGMGPVSCDYTFQQAAGFLREVNVVSTGVPAPATFQEKQIKTFSSVVLNKLPRVVGAAVAGFATGGPVGAALGAGAAAVTGQKKGRKWYTNLLKGALKFGLPAGGGVRLAKAGISAISAVKSPAPPPAVDGAATVKLPPPPEIPVLPSAAWRVPARIAKATQTILTRLGDRGLDLAKEALPYIPETVGQIIYATQLAREQAKTPLQADISPATEGYSSGPFFPGQAVEIPGVGQRQVRLARPRREAPTGLPFGFTQKQLLIGGGIALGVALLVTAGGGEEKIVAVAPPPAPQPPPEQEPAKA